jgi:hypothetical protein
VSLLSAADPGIEEVGRGSGVSLLFASVLPPPLDPPLLLLYTIHILNLPDWYRNVDVVT